MYVNWGQFNAPNVHFVVVEVAVDPVLVGGIAPDRLVAQTPAEAIAAIEEARPDLVALDITMPEMDGLELLRRVTAIDPNLVTLIITTIHPGGVLVTGNLMAPLVLDSETRRGAQLTLPEQDTPSHLID
mgnify:CR=1 FL=1